MLSEEAFLLVVFLVACASVGLGTLELVWPTRPRHPVRPSAMARDPWRRARARGAPVPDRIPVAQPLPAPPAPEAQPEPLEARAVPDVEPPMETVASATGDEPVAERCRALLGDMRFAEVVTLGEEGLAALKPAVALAPSAAAARETAQLWGVVGLAKQGLDDLEGARFAFEEAIALAPQAERPTWERNLAALTLTAARRSLDAGGADTSPSERLESIRCAIEWLGRGLAIAPDDTVLGDTLGAARDTLWRTNEELVKALIRRKDFAEARRRLDDVVADPECPTERQRAFRALWSGAMGQQARQATAQALRHVQGGREDKAVAALARAEAAMAQIPADALAPKRRQELTRRLWLGYMKIGVGRVEAGAPEAAVSPLFQALALTAVGAERLEETRATLVRAFEDVVAARCVDIAALIEAGDTSAAGIQGDKLRSLLRGAVDQGLPREDLADAFARVSEAIADMARPEMVRPAPPI